MSRRAAAGGQLPAEREPWHDPSLVLGASGPARVATDDEDPAPVAPRIRGFGITREQLAADLADCSEADVERVFNDVTVYRYVPGCEHPAAEHRRAELTAGGYTTDLDVLWCPACDQLVGPAPMPLLWEGDQA